MESPKIEQAVERLERNLPLRHNQMKLPQPLRRLHQSILRHYLEHGIAPRASELEYAGDCQSAIAQLGQEEIIVLDSSGAITGAYPFVDEQREFRVISEHGSVNAMCAFDALAISSMFSLPTRVESRCRVSGRGIAIQQDDAEIRVIAPNAEVFAAINWDARDAARSCSASLCTEMMFIAGDDNAADWQGRSRGEHELFTLGEAHQMITAVFMPLMRDRPEAA
ncbi:MAG: alkylmercury lyase family protein [Gammaproteobacteria bacterium]|nr:alkylmercury lyase family protein [Gammaproteobacteria bacterium]